MLSACFGCGLFDASIIIIFHIYKLHFIWFVVQLTLFWNKSYETFLLHFVILWSYSTRSYSIPIRLTLSHFIKHFVYDPVSFSLLTDSSEICRSEPALCEIRPKRNQEHSMFEEREGLKRIKNEGAISCRKECRLIFTCLYEAWDYPYVQELEAFGSRAGQRKKWRST